LFGIPYDEAPATTPLTPQPNEGAMPSPMPATSPSGDADPPPALPFKSSVAARTQLRPAASATPASTQRNTPRRAPVEDPPPAFPLAVAR
jgi:hypothetical protein